MTLSIKHQINGKQFVIYQRVADGINTRLSDLFVLLLSNQGNQYSGEYVIYC